MRKIYLFIISLVIFSFGIYIFKNYFLGIYKLDINNHIENNYIEPSKFSFNSDNQKLQNNTGSFYNNGSKKLVDEGLNTNTDNTGYIDNDINKNTINNKEINKLKEHIEDSELNKIDFVYFPTDFDYKVIAYTNSLKTFLDSPFFLDKIDSLEVEMHEEESDVRGKMKDHKLKLYGVQKMSLTEYNAVGVHEFAHFLDLYYFQKRVFIDMSDFFYNLSWKGIDLIKSGQTGNDFVSGYAMTNKYEDFAETFTYYVLHNNDFLKKTENSEILKKKYDFLDKYLFREKDFTGTNFSSGEEIKPYYRDITKIDYSMVEFLKFLK